MIDSIIFDMDGTLIDNVKVMTKAWNEIAKEHNMDLQLVEKDVRSVMGMTATAIADKFMPNNPKRYEIVSYFCNEECRYISKEIGQTYVPNKEFLEKLSQKYDLYIVSNCMEGYIETFLKAYNFEKYFKGFLNGSNGNNKAENIKLLVKMYNLKDPVYVGDTIIDYESCKIANVKYIFASYGFGHVENTPKITKLEELLNLEDII